MAGPSVVVRVLGDLRQLGASMDAAGSKAASGAGRARAAFGGMLSTLNRSGIMGPFSGALDGIQTAMDTVAEHGKAIGPVMLGVGGAITGIGATLSAFGSKEQASHQQLQAAIQATGHDYDEYGKQIEAAIKHQEKFGHTAGETQDALRILTQATHDPQKALALLGTTSDLAAAKHEGLAEAATGLGRVYNGNTKILKEFGIQAGTKSTVAVKQLATATTQAERAHTSYASAVQHLQDVQAQLAGKSHLTVTEQQRLRDALQRVATAGDASRAADAKLVTAKDGVKKAAGGAQANIDKLAQVLKGQASASADTFAGRLNAIKARVEDAVSAFGQKFGPALQTAGIAIMSLGSMMTLFGIESWAALLPILAIIAAIAALVVVGYVIYRNWNTIWGGIQAIVGAVWDWIKTHWPLLVGILLGPVGIAAALIITHFQQVRNAIAAVISWLTGAWNAVWAFLSRIASLIAGAFVAAANAVRAAWDAVMNFFAGIPGRIVSIFAAAGRWLVGSGQALVNGFLSGITSAWGAVAGWLGGIGGRAAQALVGAGNALYASGRAIVQGLINGFGAMAGAIRDALVGLLPGPLKKFAGLLGLASPSKLFAGYGRDTIAGFVLGIHQQAPALARELDSIGGLVGTQTWQTPGAGVPSLAPAAMAGTVAATTNAAAAAAGGPAVHIEHATFADPIDIDSLMARVAFETRRRAV